VADELPTSEEFFGASASLPTSEEFFGTPAKPPEPATPSVGGFLSGAADFVAHTLAGNPLSAWQGLSPSQKESVKEYGPAAAITAGSMFIPGGPAIQAGVNLGANAAIHGVDAYRDGESVASAMNPLNHPLETVLGVGVPAAFAAAAPIARGLRTARSWDDLGDALRLDAPLRPLPEIPKLPEVDAAEAAASAADDAMPAVPEDVVPDARGRLRRMADLARADRDEMAEAFQKVRTGTRRPARYLSRADGEGARVAGFYVEDLTHTEQRLQENGRRLIADALGGLDMSQRQQVTRILDGSEALEAASPEVQRAAVGMRDFYDQWANLAEREGLLTKELIDDEMLGQGGFRYRKFERIGENYSPLIKAEETPAARLRAKVRGLYRKDTVSHARRPMGEGDAEVEYLTDALEIANKYTDDYAKKIAIARTFGSDIGAPLTSKPWGKKANDLYAVIQSEGDDTATEVFSGMMDRLYSGQSEKWNDGLAKLNARLTSSLLGGSWMTQLGQLASPIWRWGGRNTLEGMARYYSDPRFRELIDASGVRDAGYANIFGREGGSLASAPIRAIGGVERFLRGPMNAGVVPYLENIAGKIDGADPSAVSRAVSKQLEELMLTPERLSAEGLSSGLLKDAIQASGRRAQFHAGTLGQTGNAFMSPGMKQMFSLQPFGWSAYTALLDDMVEPLLSRDSDASLRLLGLSRLARAIPATLAAESIRELVHSGVTLNEPNPREMLANATGTLGGTPGQILGSQLILDRAVDPRFGFIPPALGFPLSIGSDLYKGNLGRAGVDLAAVADPTGYMALARPTLKGLLAQMSADDRKKRR
jgi:hypothetical protein